MFELRSIPAYLVLCALALAAWTVLFPGSTPPSAFTWALGGLMTLYAVSAVLLRAGRSDQSVKHALAEAAEVNAARAAAPRPSPSARANR